MLHYNVETVGDYVEPGRERGRGEKERERGREGGGEERGKETEGKGEKRRVKEEGEIPTIPFEDEPSTSTGLYFRNGPLPADTISLTSEEGQTASNRAAADFCRSAVLPPCP